MLTTIKLTVGGKPADFPMLSTGTTAIRYRGLFGCDLMTGISDMDKAKTLDYDVIARLAYVMNAQATGKDFKTITQDDYLAWLDALDGDAIITGAGDILSAYITSRKPTATPKKAHAPQTAR